MPAPRFYGHVMLPVAVLMAACTLPGQTIVVSQFNAPIREALGLSLSQISAAYLVGTTLAALPLTFVGRAADRFGLRVVVGVVAAAFAGALAVLGQARGLISLTLGFALVRFLGQGSLSLLASHTLAMWFERRLGVMESVKHVGFSVATLLVPLLTVALIGALGWRRALLVLGVGVAALLLPLVATVFRNRPEEVGQHLDGDAVDPHAVGAEPREPGARDDPAFTLGEALRTRALWTLLLSGPYMGLVGTALLFHTQPLLASLGVADPVATAPKVQAPWPIALGVTPFFAGWLVDRVEARWLIPVGLSLCGAACGSVALAGSSALGLAPTTWVAGGMGLLGFSGGLLASTIGPTVARYFGRTHHGAIRGVTFTVAVLATAAGPFLFSEGARLAGGRFDAVFAASAVAALPLAALALTLRRPVRP